MSGARHRLTEPKRTEHVKSQHAGRLLITGSLLFPFHGLSVSLITHLACSLACQQPTRSCCSSAAEERLSPSLSFSQEMPAPCPAIPAQTDPPSGPP